MSNKLSNSFKKFKDKYTDYLVYGNKYGAQKLKKNEKKSQEDKFFALKKETVNLRLIKDKLDKIKEEDLYDTRILRSLERYIINPMRAYNINKINSTPINYSEYKSLNQNPNIPNDEADIYTWYDISVNKLNVGAVPCLIELFINCMMMSDIERFSQQRQQQFQQQRPQQFQQQRPQQFQQQQEQEEKSQQFQTRDEEQKGGSRLYLKLPKSYEKIINYLDNTADKNLNINIDVSNIDTNRIRLLDNILSTNMSNIKKMYYEKILGLKIDQSTGEIKVFRPTEEELQKNINIIFSDKNIPSNNDLNILSKQIADRIIPYKYPFYKIRDYIIDEYHKTLTSTLIIIRKNFINLLKTSNEFRNDIINMINTSLFDSIDTSKIIQSYKQPQIIKIRKPKISFILRDNKTYDLLSNVQLELHKDKVINGVLRKTKEDLDNLLNKMSNNINIAYKNIEYDIQSFTTLNKDIEIDVEKRRKDKVRDYKNEVEFVIDQNIALDTYDNISNDFIERFNEYINIRSKFIKYKDIIIKFRKEKITAKGASSVEELKIYQEQYDKLIEKITSILRQYLEQRGGALYLETFYNVLRKKVANLEKQLKEELKKDPQNKEEIQKLSKEYTQLDKQLKNISSVINANPGMITITTAIVDQLNYSTETKEKGLKTYLSEKDNISLQALFYNPTKYVQSSLIKKYGSIYVPFQRLLSTNVGLIDIFTGEIIENIEKIPGGKMDKLFHVITFINSKNKWNFFPAPSRGTDLVEYRKKAIVGTYLDPDKYKKDITKDIYKAELVRLRTGFVYGESTKCKDIYDTLKRFQGKRIDEECRGILDNPKASINLIPSLISLDDFMDEMYKLYEQFTD